MTLPLVGTIIKRFRVSTSFYTDKEREIEKIDARQLKEENGKPMKFDKINAKKGLGEMKNLPPFPNIPIPGIPFPQFPFPPPFDIPNVPPLPDFPFPPIPFPLSPPA
ncbi:hypothetical protein H0E87_021264 [Populus deltoides]|uniref:Uncharacterized protein n=1 Tax=Populus deltoides TaxID=3696 RepID=A0A8T2XNX5_POPDE|nr:hypothetical protein H0E87_021264 [Populus deltoides]